MKWLRTKGVLESREIDDLLEKTGFFGPSVSDDLVLAYPPMPAFWWRSPPALFPQLVTKARVVHLMETI